MKYLWLSIGWLAMLAVLGHMHETGVIETVCVVLMVGITYRVIVGK